MLPLCRKNRSLRIFPPRRAWFILNSVGLAVLVLTGFWFVRFSSAENQRLIDSQWETLTRSRIADLNRADYRSFVEGIGRDFADLYVEISGGAEKFKAGNQIADGHCRTGPIELVRAEDLVSVSITMCRPFQSPVAIYSGLALIYLLFALLSVRMISLLEAASVRTLSHFFQGAGIRTEEKDGIVGILSRLEEILAALSVAQAKEIATEKSYALGKFAAQVAHDLRSPIMALNVALEDISLLPETKRNLAVNSVARVKDIAKSLMDKERELRFAQNEDQVSEPFQPAMENFSIQNIAALVETVIEEKKSVLGTQTKVRIHWEVESGQHKLHAEVQASEFTRITSNLLNNAIESIFGEGHVIVLLRSTPDLLVLEITDTGKGIPEAIVRQVGKRGFTSGKADGNGLGLYHAKSTIESWNGSFAIESIEGEGTMVALGLAKYQAE